MNRSCNEVEALVKRAARGVNQSWGMADESARATRWLVERGLPGPEAMLQLLELHDADTLVKPVVEQEQWSSASGDLLCPVITGTALSDFSMLLAQYKSIHCTDVACPLLLLPFVAQASLTLNACLSMCWESVHCVVEGNRVAMNVDTTQMEQGAGASNAASAAVIVELNVAAIDEQLKSQPDLREIKRVPRASVEQQCWTRLGAYAHRTYAPASEESRRLGAGAGDSDND